MNGIGHLRWRAAFPWLAAFGLLMALLVGSVAFASTPAQAASDSAGHPSSTTADQGTRLVPAGRGRTTNKIVQQQAQQATITLIKSATPQDGTNFSFITDLPGSPLVTLDDANPDDNDGITNTFTAQVDPGSYNVIEAAQVGWTLTGISCVKSDPGIGVVVNSNLLFFTIGAGQSLTCTFTNVKQGNITVIKSANPQDGTNFTLQLGGGCYGCFHSGRRGPG
jgi:hypothetical protein